MKKIDNLYLGVIEVDNNQKIIMSFDNKPLFTDNIEHVNIKDLENIAKSEGRIVKIYRYRQCEIIETFDGTQK